MQVGQQNRAGAGGAGGAPQWVAGAQKEGALVYNAGYVYRVKQDIANGQTAPTATTAFYLQLAYDDTSIYALARGVRDRVDALDRNVIRWNRPRRITIPSGGGNPSYVSGDAFVVFAASTSGSSSLFTLTAQDYPRQGDYLSIQVRADSVPLTVKGLPFGSAAGPNTVTFAPGLLYELHAATDSTTDSTANYWVVHSTPSTGSGTPGGAFGGYTEEPITAFPFTSAGTTTYGNLFGVFVGGLKNTKPSADNSFAPHYTLSFDSAGHVTVTPVGDVPNPIPEGTCLVYTGVAGTGTPTPTTKLATPTGLKQSAVTSTSVTMSWDAAANASGYRLRRNGSTVLMPGTATTYTDTGLASGSTPSYEVQAIGTGAYTDSDYSASVTATVGAATGDTQAPTAPGQPTASSITTTSALIMWPAATDNTGVVGYQIHNAAGGGTIGSVSGTVTQYQASGLNTSTAYGLYITATDAAGNISPASPTVNFTTLTPGGQRPAVPAGYLGFVAPDGGSRLRIEETGNGIISPNYSLDGNWIDGGGNDRASGGNFKYILTAPGRVQYIGYFDYAELGAIRSTSAGQMKLTIDGTSYPTINLAENAVAGSDEFQALFPLATLTWGEHTLVLEYIDGTGTGILDFVDFYTRTY